MRTLEERFEAKYIPEPMSGCWLWVAALHGNGRYGMMWNKHDYASAHRISWELYRGPIPEDKFVLHKCDLGLCVNPDHLFLGTQTDNMRDMLNKGRGNWAGSGRHGNHARGEQSGAARYSDKLVGRMRNEYDAGSKNIAALARRHCVSESQTRRIVWLQTRG